MSKNTIFTKLWDFCELFLLKSDLAVAVFLFSWRFLYAAFLFEGTQTGGVGDFIEIIQTLADGSEIARWSMLSRSEAASEAMPRPASAGGLPFCPDGWPHLLVTA